MEIQSEASAVGKVKSRKYLRELMPLLGFMGVIVAFSIATGGKITAPANLSLMLSQVYVLLISSMGVFMVMTVGGLDFSQGSILGLSSIVFCWVSGHSIVAGIAAAALAGAAMGAFNGFFHVRFRIASFIVTICTMYFFRGLCKYITTNGPVPAIPEVLELNLTWLKLLLAAVMLMTGFAVWRFTRVGCDLRAIGAGETAARFSGCRPDLRKFLVFTAAGAITGFASFINVVKVGSITGTAGSQLETQILIALVLGGMPISGGAKARFSNIIIGTLTYCVLEMSLPMVFPIPATQQLVKGMVFLVVVALTIDHESLRVIK
ncbi:MAG TPA: ABC transporter permease [Spirochaetales bacterium]|nr:ABC transporter permease [Spirochaetales bacterium]HRY54986.1 ABC transporter permease [Spirochaetia bacterium]